MLREKGLPVTDAWASTPSFEIMDGQVKTLIKNHGGLLCRRDVPEHLAQAK